MTDVLVPAAGELGGGRSRPRAWRSVLAGLPAATILLAFLLVWQFGASLSGQRPQVLPTPVRVVEQGWRALPELWMHTLPTLTETVVGFAVSLALAWSIAIVIDFSSFLRQGLMPLLVASQTIPVIAIAPLLIIWFGFGLLPKVLVIILVTFFPIVVGLSDGFRSSDREATNLLRSMGASRWTIFLDVRLPSALPSFFTSLRIAITYAVVGAIFAEYVGAQLGLGIYMQQMKNLARTDLVLAAVVITSLISVTLFALTYVAERLVIPWYFRIRQVPRD